MAGRARKKKPQIPKQVIALVDRLEELAREGGFSNRDAAWLVDPAVGPSLRCRESACGERQRNGEQGVCRKRLSSQLNGRDNGVSPPAPELVQAFVDLYIARVKLDEGAAKLLRQKINAMYFKAYVAAIEGRPRPVPREPEALAETVRLQARKIEELCDKLTRRAQEACDLADELARERAEGVVLRAELEELRRRVAVQEAEIRQARVDEQRARDEITELCDKLARRVQEACDLADELARERAERDELRRRLTAQDGELRQARDGEQRARQDAEAYRKKVLKLRAYADRLEARIAELESEINAALTGGAGTPTDTRVRQGGHPDKASLPAHYGQHDPDTPRRCLFPGCSDPVEQPRDTGVRSLYCSISHAMASSRLRHAPIHSQVARPRQQRRAATDEQGSVDKQERRRHAAGDNRRPRRRRVERADKVLYRTSAWKWGQRGAIYGALCSIPVVSMLFHADGNPDAPFPGQPISGIALVMLVFACLFGYGGFVSAIDERVPDIKITYDSLRLKQKVAGRRIAINCPWSQIGELVRFGYFEGEYGRRLKAPPCPKCGAKESKWPAAGLEIRSRSDRTLYVVNDEYFRDPICVKCAPMGDESMGDNHRRDGGPEPFLGPIVLYGKHWSRLVEAVRTVAPHVAITDCDLSASMADEATIPSKSGKSRAL